MRAYAAAVTKPALLLVEDNPTEATLARTALTLHGGGLEVIQARDLAAAAKVLSRADRDVALAILGKRALGERGPALGVTAVAIAPDICAGDKERAAAAGIEAVYERPRQWNVYSALVARLLAQWLPTRTGSAPRPDRTS